MVLEFSSDLPPLPPLDLIERVSRPFTVEEAATVCDGFDNYPREQLRALERALAVVDRKFGDFHRLLDFGCGPGRYLRHLGPLAVTTELHGADVDEDAIRWLGSNVGFGEFTVIPHTPPTPYADGWFDLVINHSVFTHLDVDMQDLWLAELHRITQPGAIVLLTVHGLDEWERTMQNFIRDGKVADVEALRERFERDGVVFFADDHYVGSAHTDRYHTTFHAPGYVIEHWAAWFDVVAYLPLGALVQDLVVLRRPASDRPHRRAPGSAVQSLAALTTEQIDAAIETLAARIAGRATGTRHSWRRRPDGARMRTDMEILDVLRQLSRQLAAQRKEMVAREREVAMLRVGVYEQGRRMSLIAQQLRDEFGRHDE